MVNQQALNAEVQQQVDELRATFSSGKTRPLEWRIEQLKNMQRMMVTEKEKMCKALAMDLRKSEFEAYSMEVNPVEHELQHQLDHIREWAAPQYQSMGALEHLVISMTGHGRAALYYDPLGVCLVIGAWNYPLHLTLLPVVGAIAAGNTVLIKTPSPKYSPHTAKLIAELVPQYLDTSAVQVVEGGREGTQAVLLPRYDHIFFTGGERVGKMVAESAARHMTPTVLELGGKSPCIVDKSANIGTVARRMMWGKFTNAGQTCIAADHCYVHADVADAFVEACKTAIKEFYGDDPKASPDLARIINDGAWLDQQDLLEGTEKYQVCGGQLDRETKYVAPTVLYYGADEAAWEKSPAMQKEIFGPILPVVQFTDLDKVITRIGGQEKPLAMYIWSNDSAFTERLLTETTAGHCVVNDILLQFCAPIPFGGVGKSGMGSYHGKWSFKTFSHEKGVLKRHPYGEIPARFPPYGPQWKQLLVGLLTKAYSARFLKVLKLVIVFIVLRFTPVWRMVAPTAKAALTFTANML